MKRTILLIFSLLVLGYFVNSYLEKDATAKSHKAARNKIEQAVKSAVAQMVSQTNAVDDWMSRLSKGERFRSEPILTVELESLWLQNRPILFIGSIRDIASQDPSHYLISIEPNINGSFDNMFYTELQLSLIIEKERMDSFLKNHPDLFKNNGFNNSVAVVARINAIRTQQYIPGAKSTQGEVRIGDGELVNLLYTGDVIF